MTPTTRPPRRRGLSDKQVQALPRRDRRYVVADPDLRGHYIRVPPTGPATFAAVARDPSGKQIWAKTGTSDVTPIETARDKAREVIRRIRAGLPAVEPPPPKAETFGAVAQSWLVRHVAKKGLRSRGEIERILRKYCGRWADLDITAIKRSHVTTLLDHVEDRHGARQADAVLAIVRAVCNWHAARIDGYMPPFTKEMNRTEPKKRARSRVLDDDELRRIWHATADLSTYSGMVRFALLTAQRRAKITSLRWGDVQDGVKIDTTHTTPEGKTETRQMVCDGVWVMRFEAREKGAPGQLVLPRLALDVIAAQPRFVSNSLVFAGRNGGPFGAVTEQKRKLDAKLPGMAPWVFHDLRRTARSLMARAGVPREHAEKVLGHSLRGVEGVYNRFEYTAEMGHALARLAALIETIINPPSNNVVPWRPAAQPV